MKKATMTAIAAYIENVPELATEYAELRAELNKNAEKAEANRNLYEAARAIVLAHMSKTEPQTIAEIYEAAKADLPSDFSKSKVQYAMLERWSEYVKKHDNGKKAYTYTLA